MNQRNFLTNIGGGAGSTMDESEVKRIKGADEFIDNKEVDGI
jgi:hypothetical protein